MSYFRPEIEAMDGYAPGFQPKGEGFVKLNTNENPHPPSDAVMAALREAAGANLRKYPDPVASVFRAAAADVLGTRPERVLCGNGSDDLLNIAMRSICAGGDVVAFPWPTYSLYPVLARIQGARVIQVDFPDDYSLPSALSSTGARLTLLCNPNAPSGTLVPPARIGELAAALQGVLLVDEAYVDFAEEDCLDLVDAHDNVVVTRTLSKSYALAGLRFGYAVAQEHLIRGLMKVKDSYNVDALAIAGATAAIRDRDWLRRTVQRINETRARLTQELERMGFRCWPSQTNFVLARVPAGTDAARVHQMLFERKVLVRYFDQPRLNDCLRISVGSPADTEALLKAMEQIISAPEITGGT